MDNLIKVALMVLADRRPNTSGASRITAGALCTGFAVIAMAAGIACGLAALWIFLIPRVGSAAAALTVAGVLLVSSGVLMLMARSLFSSDDEDEDGLPRPAFGEELLDEFREGFENNKTSALLAALVAGLAAGSASRK
jgi:hypothetical protein